VNDIWLLMSAALTVAGLVAAAMVFPDRREQILVRWHILRRQIVIWYQTRNGRRRHVSGTATLTAGVSVSGVGRRVFAPLDPTTSVDVRIRELERRIQDVEDRAREREAALLPLADERTRKAIERYDEERMVEVRAALPYERWSLVFLGIASLIGLFR